MEGVMCWIRYESLLVYVAAALLAVVTSGAGVSAAGLSFSDVTQAWGYDTSKNAVYWQPLTGDFDGDGDQDVFVLGHHYDGRDPALVNLVFQNEGGGKLQDVTAAALGAATHSGNHGFIADYNGDGRDDVFVTADQHSLDVYLGGRAPGGWITFTRQDILPGAYSCAALADLDGDGLLDAYAGHPNPGYRDGAFSGTAEKTWTPSSELTEQLRPQQHGAQTVWAGDYNGDGVMDLYYCEWWYDQEYLVSLFRGTGRGQFVRDAPGCGIPLAGGLLTFIDIDNDGDTDALSDGKLGFRLFVNDGRGQFSIASNDGGLATAASDARTVAGDLDLDGDLDLVISGRVWLNDGSGQFTKSIELPVREAPALADLDGDGDLDLITISRIFRNDLGPASWIKIRLRGDANNPAAGARFELRQKHDHDRGRLAGSGQLTLADRISAAPEWVFGVEAAEPYTLHVWFPGAGAPVIVNDIAPGRTIEVTPTGVVPPRQTSCLQLDLLMPSDTYSGGSAFELTARLVNNGMADEDILLPVLLIAGGQVYYGPHFSTQPPARYAKEQIPDPGGCVEHQLLALFEWPDTSLAAGSATFVAAALTPSLQLASNIVVRGFSWQ